MPLISSLGCDRGRKLTAPPTVLHHTHITVANSGMRPEYDKTISDINFCKGFSQRNTHSLTSTSPAPGSGVSNISTFVEIVPGLSYTTALYCLGISNVWVSAAAIVAVGVEGLLFNWCFPFGNI
jgi:hypothetical protein